MYKIKSVKLIEELEPLKDIVWFLKGKVSENENSELSSHHIESLEEIIQYVYDNEIRKEEEKEEMK